VAGVVIFIVPIIFPSLNDKIVKICLIILIIILVEIIAFRVNGVIANKSNREQLLSKNNLIDQQINELTPTINHKNLGLFLYTKDISISNLIPKTTYSPIILPNVNNNMLPINKVQLFNHYTKPLLAIEINDCETVLSNLNSYPIVKKLLSLIKKNNSHDVNIAVSASTIFNSEENKDDLFLLLRCIHALKNCVKKKFNVNLLIDSMGNVPGFKTFLQSAHNMEEKTHLFCSTFNTNVSYKHDILEQFEANFTKFLFSLETETLLMNFDNPEDMKNVHTFIQQLHYSRERLKTLLAHATNICNVHTINKLNNITISIRFFHSQDQIHKIDALASKELQLCCQI
jgi:hypothetical protein